MSASEFNFLEPAELYVGRRMKGRSSGVTYKRFNAAAEVIRYVIEELSSASQRSCFLEVNEDRFNHIEIRKLYDDSDYPFPRFTGKDKNTA